MVNGIKNRHKIEKLNTRNSSTLPVSYYASQLRHADFTRRLSGQEYSDQDDAEPGAEPKAIVDVGNDDGVERVGRVNRDISHDEDQYMFLLEGTRVRISNSQDRGARTLILNGPGLSENS